MGGIITGLLALSFLQLHGTDGQLACPSGFEVHDKSCYFFSHGQETWNGAFESCKLFSAKLVEVNDDNENNYLSHKTDYMNKEIWIGLTDKLVVGEYIWETSLTQLSSNMTSYWASNEPDARSDENCIYYSPGKGNKWGDDPCSRTKYYACEIDGGISGIIIG